MRINHENWLRVLSPGANRPADENPDRPLPPRTDFLPGQQVKGEVLARLSEQVYLVRIAGQAYRTELPLSLRPGDPLELTFRAAEPRLSFTLRDITLEASAATISSTAARLSRVMSEVQGGPAARPAVAFAPLLDAHPSDPAGMAASIQKSLAFSGLFYESHVVRWLLGERLLADLMKEPQARLAMLRGKRNGDGPQDVHRQTEGEETLTPGPAGPSPADCEPAGIIEQLLGADSLFSLPMVREQLALLLSGVVRWQGEVWHGQEMEWDVEREPEAHDGSEDTAWRTTIRLELPRLGAIAATLSISGSEVRGRITAGSSESVAHLKRELDRLKNGMAETGLRLTEMAVDCEPVE